MNKPVYDKNMETLEKKYPVWAEILRSRKRKKPNFDVLIEKSYTDESILKINDRGHVLYLNGKYAPSAFVEEWLIRQGKINQFATIIIVGISNGVHIKKIMERVPKTVNILIYEPSFEIFRRAMEEVDLSFLFQPNIPVGIIVSEINEFETESYFHYMITYDNMVSLKIFMSGNYQELFPKEIGEFVGALKEYLKNVEVGWNTTIRYTDVNAKNVFHNLPYLYGGYAVSDLKNILPEKVPVIIVSAGPSLNKNMSDLKEAVGKSCIIATDTAMKPLLNAGIIPDLFMIVDGLKPAELFEHKDISKVPMVTMTAVSTEPMDLHKGKKFFYDSGSPYETEMVRMIDAMEERDVCLPGLPTGGSVATSAFSLGVYMGAKTIILVGQDLALTGNKVHVDGAFQNEKCKIDMSSGQYLEVDAVGGGKVVTQLDFKLYLDWFEKIIKEWDHIQVVDATEGGALIHGAKNMTLKRAINKYCVQRYNTKWHIDRVPKLINTPEEKTYALRYLGDSINDLEEVKKKAEVGLKYYDRLQELANKKECSSNQLQKTYKKIKHINSYMENNSMAEMVMDSLKGIEYVLRPTIYQMNSDEHAEIEDVVRQGKLMLKSILVAVDEIEKIVKETIIPFVEKIKRSECSIHKS